MKTTELPGLPKRNKQREADFGIELRRWIERHPELATCSLEIKHTRGKAYFDLSEFKNEQAAFAHMIGSREGCLIRIIGTKGEPDYVFMRNEASYVVIRYPKAFYIISSSDIMQEKKYHSSIDEARARKLAICSSE